MYSGSKLNPLFFQHKVIKHPSDNDHHHQQHNKEETKERLSLPPDIVVTNNKGTTMSSLLMEPRVFFKDICQEFIQLIEIVKPDYLLGCHFMFTDHVLLKYLQEKQIPVAVIIQKQAKKWYRNGCTTNPRKEYDKKQAIELRNYYDNLTPLSDTINAVSCIGNIYSTKANKCQTIFHHKFWIFMRKKYEGVKNDYVIGVFSGSYNFTFNARTNYEDARIDYSPPFVLSSYYNKFLEYMPQAESLDFSSGPKERKRKKVAMAQT